MPRINIQVVGLIEIELPAEVAASCACGDSGLWHDLVLIGAEPCHVAIAQAAEPWPEQSSRWNRDDELSSRLPAAPILYADLPRLSRQLGEELGLLVERLCAAREA